MRRRFVAIESSYPSQCTQILDLLGQLYAMERLVAAVAPDGDEQQRAEALRLRAELRHSRPREVVACIRTWAFGQHPLVRAVV